MPTLQPLPFAVLCIQIIPISFDGCLRSQVTLLTSPSVVTSFLKANKQNSTNNLEWKLHQKTSLRLNTFFIQKNFLWLINCGFWDNIHQIYFILLSWKDISTGWKWKKYVSTEETLFGCIFELNLTSALSTHGRNISSLPLEVLQPERPHKTFVPDP